MSVTLIVAATLSNGIGHAGSLPWRLPAEMAYFARVTTHAGAAEGVGLNAVVMGRKTWESIPAKFRPLKDRLNVVVSRQAGYNLGSASNLLLLRPSLGAALESLGDAGQLPSDTQIRRTFLIGGASLYDESLNLQSNGKYIVDRILLTRILSPAYDQCDVFFPDFANAAKNDIDTDDAGRLWRRVKHAEMEDWLGLSVPEGVQEERGSTYEYQMWVRG